MPFFVWGFLMVVGLACFVVLDDLVGRERPEKVG